MTEVGSFPPFLECSLNSCKQAMPKPIYIVDQICRWINLSQIIPKDRKRTVHCLTKNKIVWTESGALLHDFTG